MSVLKVRRGLHTDEWPASEASVVCELSHTVVGATPIYLTMVGEFVAVLQCDADGRCAAAATMLTMCRMSWALRVVHEPGENIEPLDGWFYHPAIDEWEAKQLVAHRLLDSIKADRTTKAAQLLTQLTQRISTAKADLGEASPADVFDRLDPAFNAIENMSGW